MNPEFDDIYEKYKNNIYHLALSYTKNQYDAEDIVQNVFIKLHKNLAKLLNEAHIKNWLIKVTINDCKTYILSSWCKKVRLFQDQEEENITFTYQNDELLSTIFELPKKDRLIIHLYYYEGYSIQEIGKLLKIKKNAVKQRVRRAREKLKHILKEDML